MATGGQSKLIVKLQNALLYGCGEIIVVNTSQFYSVDKKKFVLKYHIKKQINDPDNKNKSDMIELFSSCSQLQITFYLRDLLCIKRGEEIPTDNPVWEEIKARYLEEHGRSMFDYEC